MGKPVIFYWRQGVAGLHVECAIENLMKAIQRSDRVATPYVDANHRAQFKRRLLDATRGRLTASERETPVKEIQRPEARLFEIRWQDILVDDRDPVSWLVKPQRPALVRLYYLEPATTRWVVGLHAHEKVVIEGDDEATRRLQDDEIEVAVVRATSQASEGWAVPELAGQDYRDNIR